MKEIYFDEIKNKVSDALYKATHILNDFTLNKLNNTDEKNPLAKSIICQIIENAKIAKEESIPMCQDTGIVTVFAYIGYEIHLNCDLYEAINAGVKDAYEKYYLRKSVANCLTRENTKDNTPAIVHAKMVSGDKLTLKIAPKGAGSENMSKLAMLNPTDGIEGIVSFVVNAVKEADGRPCPPLFLGVGIGGNFETCALMAKEALLSENENEDEQLRLIEKRIKEEVNKLNIGPMGLKGDTTCLDVFVKACPCHIASLPVALNIQCHANRHEVVVI